MKKLFVLLLMLSGFYTMKAQQDLLFSHYMFNQLLLNPGYAGSKEYIMATLLYRKQWMDWKGAPESQLATVHGPLGLSKFGWGVVLSHDKIGVTNRTDGYLNASYQLRVSSKLKLGMGLRGGATHFSYNNSDLVFWDPADPTFQGEQVTRILPNVGWGLWLYSDQFYFGLSNPTVISYDPEKDLSITIDNGEEVPRQVRHYFATTGYAWIINMDVVVKPSVLVKYVHSAPIEADFNLNVLLGQLVWIGGSYRTGDCYVAMLELQLTKQLRIGYSYDLTQSAIKDYSNGSHEFMLGYDFGYDIQKVKTPRYF